MLLLVDVLHQMMKAPELLALEADLRLQSSPRRRINKVICIIHTVKHTQTVSLCSTTTNHTDIIYRRRRRRQH
jgi:hypothetical protein